VGFLKDNSDWLVKFGEAAIFVAGAFVTYGIITKIAGIASAVEGLALALTANPIALLLTGVVTGGRRKEDGVQLRPDPRDHLRAERLQRCGISESQDPGQGRTGSATQHKKRSEAQ
jgi:hypothetical protein